MLNQDKTTHRLIEGDARNLGFIPDESIHLVLTSPPYWNLKKYNTNPQQLGHIDSYETMKAAIQAKRNSIGIEIDAEYCDLAANLVQAEVGIFANTKISLEKAANFSA